MRPLPLTSLHSASPSSVPKLVGAELPPHHALPAWHLPRNALTKRVRHHAVLLGTHAAHCEPKFARLLPAHSIEAPRQRLQLQSYGASGDAVAQILAELKALTVSDAPAKWLAECAQGTSIVSQPAYATHHATAQQQEEIKRAT